MKKLKEVYNLAEMITLWGKLLNGFEHGSYGTGDISSLGKRCLLKYGNKPISPLIEGYIEYELFEGQEDVSNGILEMYKDKWEHIYEVMTTEYNPIENYDRLEDSIVENTGTDTDLYGQKTNTTGAQEVTLGSRTDTIGQKQTTIGSREDTFGLREHTEGEREDSHSAKTNTEGAHNDEHIHAVAPYNTAQAVVESADSDNIAQKTNTEGAFTVTIGEQTSSDSAHTDTQGQQINTEGQQSNTLGQQINNSGQRVDTESAHSDTHEIDRATVSSGRIHGNIGVTTTQQMIDSELQLRKNLFWKIVTDDVIHELTLKIYC